MTTKNITEKVRDYLANELKENECGILIKANGISDMTFEVARNVILNGLNEKECGFYTRIDFENPENSKGTYITALAPREPEKLKALGFNHYLGYADLFIYELESLEHLIFTILENMEEAEIGTDPDNNRQYFHTDFAEKF